MYVLIYGDDLDGLNIEWHVYETYEEAYEVMHRDWLECIKEAGWGERNLHGEDREPYCLQWHAACNEYDDWGCLDRCIEWHIVKV